MSDFISHNFARIRIDSNNSLPLEETLTFHNAIILVNPVANKDENSYYYNTVLGIDFRNRFQYTIFLNEYLNIINTVFR